MNKNKKANITIIKEFISKNYNVRYNVISNRFEYRKVNEPNWMDLNENDILVDLLENHHTISQAILIALLKSDFVEKYNPFEYYFENLPKWDGVDYIGELTNYIKVFDKDLERFKTQFKRMFVRMIASALEVHLNKQSFILIGGQNSGKTYFWRWLTPSKLSDYYIENIGTDKDSYIALAENFIVNLDELATFSKKDHKDLKTMLSQNAVKLRLPYDKRTSVLKRRCSFVGSTNDEEFLSDDTGNVRWVCFAIKTIDWNYSKNLDVDKIWGQAYHLFKNNFQYLLNADEIQENEKANISFMIRTPELELLQQYYTPATKRNPFAQFVSATELTNEIAQKAYNVKIYPNRMGKALNILGYVRTSKYNTDVGWSQKGYYVVLKEQNSDSENTKKEPVYCDTEIPFNDN